MAGLARDLVVTVAPFGDVRARLSIPVQGKWAEFSFWRKEVDEEFPSGQSEVPEPWACSDQNAAAAIQWVLDLDVRAGNQVERGGRVTKRIPASDPTPMRALRDTEPAPKYRDYRRQSGELIRPLLMAAPQDAGLYPYQIEGVEWLIAHRAAILADDMGLGKTPQAIAALRRLISAGVTRTALVVSPKTLLANWESELSRWAPELSYARLTPAGKEREEAWDAVVGRVHVIVTNYEQLRDPAIALKRTSPVIIADEAHRIRNLSSLVTKGVRTLDRSRFWALTGTPIERHTSDLATLLSTIHPDRFARRDASLTPGVLRGRARPYILRRLKDDVLDQLPAVVETIEILELTGQQAASYRTTLRALEKGRASVEQLARMNELRTICDYDPRTKASIKAERIAEIIAEIRAAGEKAVVFSYLLEPLRLLAERLGPGESTIVEGSQAAEERDAVLSSFRKDAALTTLLASSRVASEGLTLTEANHVIFFNEWWNPSANAQARDRVVRIGQRRGVRVYKFRCRGTIEEALARILEAKRETFEVVIDRLAEPAPSVTDEIAPFVAEIGREVSNLAERG